MAIFPRQKKKLLTAYPIAWLIFFLASVLIIAIGLTIFSGQESGLGIAVVIALPIMFILSTLLYFFVPLSTLVLLFFVHDFVMRIRGSKALSLFYSASLAVMVWLATFPTSFALVNVLYSNNQFLQVQEGSWFFIYLYAGTNLAGLISSVLWLKLRPAKSN